MESASRASAQAWTPILSEAEMDFVFGKIERRANAEMPAAAHDLLDVSGQIAQLAALVVEYPKITEWFGVLGLACIVHLDFTYLSLIQRLKAPNPNETATESATAHRAIGLPRRFDNAAWLRQLHSARSAAR